MQNMRIEELDRLAWNQEIPPELEGNERTYCIELAYIYARYMNKNISKEIAEQMKSRLRTEFEQRQRVAELGRQISIEESERVKNAEVFKRDILKAQSREDMLLNALCCVYMLTGDKAFYSSAQNKLNEMMEVEE